MPPYPKQVYRYLNLRPDGLERLKETIQQGTLFYSKPSSFNDPFDGRVTFSFDATIKQVSEYFARVVKEQRPDLTWKQRREEVTRRLSDLDNHPSNPEFRRRMSEHHTQLLTEETGVACFSEQNDHILMWSHYADSHRGICLEFTGIEKYLPEFYKVNYSSERPSLNPIRQTPEEMLEKALFTKSEEWRYECEWRAVKYREGSYTHKIPISCLTGIILGAQIPEENENLIKEWVSPRPDIKVYRAYVSTHRFAIEIHPNNW